MTMLSSVMCRAVMFRSVAMAAGLLALPAVSWSAVAPNAPTRIAVLDREAALLGTNAAQAAQEKLAADMKPQRDKLEPASRHQRHGRKVRERGRGHERTRQESVA